MIEVCIFTALLGLAMHALGLTEDESDFVYLVLFVAGVLVINHRCDSWRWC
jgi:hypothetical protein